VAGKQDPADAVDSLLGAAAAIWPQTDLRPHSAVARLTRALSLIHSELEAVLADFDISIAGLEALVALRLSPPPHRLSQRAVGELLMRTSGTLSVRLARLEREGLVTRKPDPYDARGVTVQLTPRGLALVDEALPARFETEARLLSALSPAEQDQLCALLRTLLPSLEQREAGPRLGVEIAARRAAKELRRTYGLADGVGLLVAAVDDGSLADQAGIAGGDLILRLGSRQLRSAAQLKRAVRELRSGDELELTLLRGGRERPATVTLTRTSPARH
jgi:DNA-binding MarR family transcriptional regulator